MSDLEVRRAECTGNAVDILRMKYRTGEIYVTRDDATPCPHCGFPVTLQDILALTKGVRKEREEQAREEARRLAAERRAAWEAEQEAARAAAAANPEAARPRADGTRVIGENTQTVSLGLPLDRDYDDAVVSIGHATTRAVLVGHSKPQTCAICGMTYDPGAAARAMEWLEG